MKLSSAVIGSVLAAMFTGVAHVAAQSSAADLVAATLAAPQDRRDGATVMGFDGSGRLTTQRHGLNDLICLADNPGQEGFEVACYHVSLEPYMQRGRELTAQGVTGMDRYAIRWDEVKQGTLEMPEKPAMLYVLSGSAYDPATGKITDEYRRSTIYVPYATAQSTGLSEQASATDPWIMFPGTAGAHIMITPPRASDGGDR